MSRRTHVSNDWPVVEVVSEEEKLELVEALSAPEPGLVVTVPLMLLPAYLQYHGIEPAQYRHPVLWIKQQEH